eukprot:3602764-Pleurochrysis_carterae.AAC.4
MPARRRSTKARHGSELLRIALSDVRARCSSICWPYSQEVRPTRKDGYGITTICSATQRRATEVCTPSAGYL